MLLRRGFGPWQTLGILVGANLLLAALGTAMWRAGVADRWIFWSYLLICAIYFGLFFMKATQPVSASVWISASTSPWSCTVSAPSG